MIKKLIETEQFALGIDPGLRLTGIALIRLDCYIQDEKVKPIKFQLIETRTIQQKNHKEVCDVLDLIDRYPPVNIYCEESDGKLKREVEKKLNRVSGGWELSCHMMGRKFEFIKRSQIAYRLILNPFYKKEKLKRSIVNNGIATMEQLKGTSTHEVDAIGIATAGALRHLDYKLDFNKIIPSENALFSVC